MTRLNECAGYDDHFRAARHGAIAMRVFTLGCHEQADNSNPANHAGALDQVHEYAATFYELGRIQCPRYVFHTALMESLDYSGFR